jgi:plasmid stabilization system protein ParE
MSVPERNVALSADAQSDLAVTLYCTWRQWGEEQRDRYEAMLQQAITGLIDYRFIDDSIVVVRILDERINPTRHVRP